MLSKVENELLTQTDPGTGAGEYFRRYWIPALMTSEVPTPDCPPVRIRLLGEDLVAFRDSSGRVGLMDEFCPHRRASMFWGRNEECGLRCVYHGWKFDVTGVCIDMPNEPPEYGFDNKVRITAYPTQEYGGLIWTYMGPPDKTPELPKLEWARVPDSQRYVSKRLQECNYLQALEGGIDSSHSNFLHASVDAFRVTDSYVAKIRTSFNLRAKYHLLDKAPRFTVKKTDYGLVIAVRRNAEENTYYWRMTQFLLPSYTITDTAGFRAMTKRVGSGRIRGIRMSLFRKRIAMPSPTRPLFTPRWNPARSGRFVISPTIMGSIATCSAAPR
jgi:phenylpropionate dioxygenase-like ring-hydroxylating dioxygenase large terminal subunit